MFRTSWKELLAFGSRSCDFRRGNLRCFHTCNELEGLGLAVVVRHLVYVEKKGTARRGPEGSMAG